MKGILTRRDLLVAFLGAPIAAAACARRPFAGGLPPGELVGPSAELGHRIRDGFRPEPSAESWRDVSVAIVGGGVAGLSAAWRLDAVGIQDYVVLELEPEAGGTSRGGTSRVVGYPWGAHYVPAPFKENRALVTLFDEMGIFEGRDSHGDPVVREQYLCRDPQERIFYRGRWYEGLYLRIAASAEDLRQLDAFREEMRRWDRWRDARGRPAFAIPVSRCSDDPEVTALDGISMRQWMDERNFTSPRLRWYVAYACRDDYGASLERTSAWAGVFYFTSRVGEESDEAQSLVTWPEGNAHLVGYLAGRAGDRLHTGLAACDVRPVGEGADARVEVVAYDVTRNTAVGIRAQYVICAAPRYLVPKIVAPFRDDAPSFLAEFEYGSWTVANLHLSDRPKTPPLSFLPSWDNVLYESPSLGYINATHQALLDYGPTVFTWYYPVIGEDPKAAREKLLGQGRDEWAEIALSDLEVAHPEIRSLTERVDVMRWGHAMITPRPGFMWGGARERAAAPFRRIHFAHTDLSGVALFEEALDHGVRAAEEVATALGRRVVPM